MSILDKFEQYNKKDIKSITQLSIDKSGYVVFSVDFTEKYGLGEVFETLSFFYF